jgi:hypothetical protein
LAQASSGPRNPDPSSARAASLRGARSLCRPVSPTRRNAEHQREELSPSRTRAAAVDSPVLLPLRFLVSPLQFPGAAAWRARPLPVPSPWPPSPRAAAPRVHTRWDSRGVPSPPREARRAPACASWHPAPRWTRSRRELPVRRLRSSQFRPTRPRRARRWSLSPK